METAIITEIKKVAERKKPGPEGVEAENKNENQAALLS